MEHRWLNQTEGTMNKVVLSTDKLKKFIIRRKWQVCNGFVCAFRTDYILVIDIAR